MEFRRADFTASNLRSLAWDRDKLVDWLGGGHYALDGQREETAGFGAYRFDATAVLDGWGAVFESLGTKAVLLRDNGQRRSGNILYSGVDVLREVDRSYYRADNYHYPITLFRLPSGQPVLAHCPRGYNIIDLEDFDGKRLTARSETDAADVFHSRLQASVDGRWLLSNGWVWQPFRVVCVYDVARALEEPTYLSTLGEKLDLGDAWEGEVEAATFVGDRIVCAANEEQHALSIYDLAARRHAGVIELEEAPGTRLMALDDDHVFLLDGHPRLLKLSTGKIVERWDDLESGRGIHQPSVNLKPPTPPWLAMDSANQRFALGWPDRIVVVAVAR